MYRLSPKEEPSDFRVAPRSPPLSLPASQCDEWQVFLSHHPMALVITNGVLLTYYAQPPVPFSQGSPPTWKKLAHIIDFLEIELVIDVATVIQRYWRGGEVERRLERSDSKSIVLPS